MSNNRYFMRALMASGAISVLVCAGLARDSWALADPARARAQSQLPTSGSELYEVACAKCHGRDGKGVDLSTVAFDVPLPDFSDCWFAAREPDADWIAVTHQGGPIRGFDRAMPAFGEALTEDQLQAIMDHIRTLCTDTNWPRGELNLPRPLVTEKAYPEDEAVWTTTLDIEGQGAVINELLYERRFGARSQFEIKVPFGVRELPGRDGDWGAGIGDVSVGVKHAVYHDLDAGSIVSLGAEVILPTGDQDRGFSKGTTVLEPFIAFGQLLPSDAFLHLQGGLELATDTDDAPNEAFWRLVLGKSWSHNTFGRSLSPMVELLAETELGDGGVVEWDLLPQMQVTLNTRQHVMANLGVRIPLTHADGRGTQLLLYLLWDWFDGGFFDGW